MKQIVFQHGQVLNIEHPLPEIFDPAKTNFVETVLGNYSCLDEHACTNAHMKGETAQKSTPKHA